MMRDAAGAHLGSEELEARDELREHEDLVPLGEKRVEQLEERVELPGSQRGPPAREGRVAADLAQAGERGEDIDPVLPEAARRRGELLDEPAASRDLGEVEAALPGGELHGAAPLGPGGQAGGALAVPA